MTYPVEPIRIAEWSRYPWLAHGFSTRRGGISTTYGPADLNLGFTTEDQKLSVAENRRLLTKDVDPDATLIVVRQVHGAVAIPVLSSDFSASNPPPEADGLLTALPNLLLAIQTADCVPVLIADTTKRVVAAFHAGWKGTVAGIVEQGVATMRDEYNSHVSNLIAAIGPSIGPCCYAVGDQLRQEFGAAFPYASDLFHREGDALHLDLWKANRRQLLAAGLTSEQIATVSQCTACTFEDDGQRRFFSHRAEKGYTGRMMSVVGVRGSSNEV